MSALTLGEGVDLDLVRGQLATLGRDWTPRDVATALRDSGLVVSDANVLLTVEALHRDSVGVGPLEPLLAIAGVTDVLVDGPQRVLIDRGAGLELTDVRFSSDEQVRRLAVRLASSVGRRLDDSVPFVDARLANGIRLHAILSPLADPGTCICLRVPACADFDLQHWVSNASMPPRVLRLLERVVAAKTAFLVSGGTGSGKTTLLAGLLGVVPPNERVLIVEDSRELSPAHPNCVRLEGRLANSEGAGSVTLTDLVRQALRMRPDRLVLGEVRGAELCDLLMALNTGHEGGCGTVHANSAADVVPRLEALASLGGMSRAALHAQVAAALQLVIHVRREPDGRRRVGELGVFVTGPDGWVRVQPALVVDRDGCLTEGVGYPRLMELVR